MLVSMHVPSYEAKGKQVNKYKTAFAEIFSTHTDTSVYFDFICGLSSSRNYFTFNLMPLVLI